MQQPEYNKLKYYTISVPVATGQRIYPIDQNSPLNGAFIQSVWTRRGGSGIKTLQGVDIVNDANFDSTFLVLKKDTQTKVVEIPLKHIESASTNEPQTGFPIFAYDLNWSTCTFEIGEGVTVDDGNAFEITVAYFEKKK